MSTTCSFQVDKHVPCKNMYLPGIFSDAFEPYSKMEEEQMRESIADRMKKIGRSVSLHNLSRIEEIPLFKTEENFYQRMMAATDMDIDDRVENWSTLSELETKLLFVCSDSIPTLAKYEV